VRAREPRPPRAPKPTPARCAFFDGPPTAPCRACGDDWRTHYGDPPTPKVPRAKAGRG